MMTRARTTIAIVALLCSGAAHAADPGVTCESGKLKESAKYSSCRLKADAKAVKKGAPADYSKCNDKFNDKFPATETKAGPSACPSEMDVADIGSRITDDAATIATLLAGGVPVECGNGVADGDDQCDGGDLGGQTCQGLGYTLGGSLACTSGCSFETSDCASQHFPASGQTTSYGAGSDGDAQAGAPLAYEDNGDGTITDLNTGLIWEKKGALLAGVHDKNNLYTWSTGTNDFDGTLATDFLATLNDTAGGGAACFTGHCDWRIPNAKELASIVDYERTGPSADPVFQNLASCGSCADITLAACSCTANNNHWSSTTCVGNLGAAWQIDFNGGVGTTQGNKTVGKHARAVRTP